MDISKAILSIAGLLTASLAAAAQDAKVTTLPDRGETRKVYISGSFDIDLVHRDEDLIIARGQEGTGSEDETTVEGDLRLRLDIELAKNLKGALAVKNRRFDAGVTLQLGDNPEETLIIFEEASVSASELFVPELSLRVGILPVAFDLRGKGSAFFFDPARSNTFSKNAGAGGAAIIGAEDELQPAGAAASWKSGALTATLFALPSIITGGQAQDNEQAYGAWILYDLESLGKGSRAGVFYSAIAFAGHETSVHTAGAGIVVRELVEGLELYGEGYVQFGDAGVAVIVTPETLDARQRAFQVGAEFRLPGNPNNISFGANLTWVGGTDEPDEVHFLSYENVNDLKIVEDQWFGFDLDTNYWAVKFSGGIAFSVGDEAGKNNLEIGAVVGIAKLREKVVAVSGEEDDKVGTEVDGWIRLWASAQVSFELGGAVLTGSKILENTLQGEDRTELLWLGTNFAF